jgi:hypothetical protein
MRLRELVTASRWMRRARAESGFAVPMVMLSIMTAFALASVTVVASVNSQHGTIRDQGSKSAFAAAEAGVNEALLHYNKIPTVSPLTCLIGSPVVSSAPSGGWCAPVTAAMPGVTGGSFTYWVKPTTGQLQIVSQGNVNGVSRRIQVIARSSGGLQPFGQANVIGLNFITMASNASVVANVATNGDITMSSNALIDCDYAQVGVGHHVVGSSNYQFNCPVAQGPTSLPPVNQGDVATNNSNGNFFSRDPYSSGMPSWNASTRQLSFGSNSKLTLTGSNYSFCKLTMSSNAELIIAAGAVVRIYFDSPEACGLPNNTAQVDMSSNTRISPTGGNATHVALLFVGSDTLTTRVNLSSNTQVPDGSCEQDFVVYAPRTDVTMASNSTFCGGVGAKSVTMASDADITTNALATDFELPNSVAAHYAPEQFVECLVAPTSSTPDSGC